MSAADASFAIESEGIIVAFKTIGKPGIGTAAGTRIPASKQLSNNSVRISS